MRGNSPARCGSGEKTEVMSPESYLSTLKEISAVWGEIADIDQAALLELLGGKRNATAVVSLLTNFVDAERAFEVAMDSAGSALAENEKWLTGIEGHLSQFSAAFEDLSRNAIDSELFKGLIDTGTLFIDVLNGIAGGVWALATSMIMGAVKAVKDMAENVKRLDAELIELKKVTDLTRAGYEAIIDEAAVSARVIGAKLSDTIRAEADFARLGYDVAGQAQSLAQAALVYQHVGDGIRDISEASESIISTMKAFGIEAENAMGIVDEFNEVGNKFAISSSGIGEAMQRSSASLAAANNTLEESIGLTVGMNAVIQNPEIVGTALKTLSMYLRAAKADLEATGESTEGMASSTSKLRASILALTGQKVDIQLDENTFKSTYQILKEISAVWDKIADIDQAALLELLGGKHNATAVVSLLTNFADAERAFEVAMDSAGSALAENEKWLTGIEGHLSQFSAAFEDLSRNIIDSELFKGLIDTGTLFIDVLNGITGGLDKVTGGLGGIPVAVAAITGAMGLMSKSGVKGGPFDFQPGDIQTAAESVKAFVAHIKK